MAIKGYQGTSLLDYPGRIASLVFFSGCNLTCPFCHNPALITSPDSLPDLPPDEILDDLKARRRFIDGVVVTGGEPTFDAGLLDFMRELKNLGLLVKLDTNGLAPKVVARALREGLIDYLALDLKTSPERYGELHTRPVPLGSLERTIGLMLESGVEHEVRTTCVPGFVGEREIHMMGRLLAGVRRWVLQQYAPDHAMEEKCRRLDPYPAERIRALAELARRYVDEVTIRGLV